MENRPHDTGATRRRLSPRGSPPTLLAPAAPGIFRDRCAVLDRRQLANLGEPDVVARRIAEGGVDPVGPLLRLLGEIDAAPLELLVRGLAVLGGQEDRPGEALRHQASYLLTRLGVHH